MLHDIAIDKALLQQIGKASNLDRVWQSLLGPPVTALLV